MQLSSSIRKALQGALITLASVTTLSALVAPQVWAAKAEMSKKVGTPLKEAQSLIAAKKYKEAMAKIKEADAVSGKSAYEEKVINEMQAAVYFALRDYANGAAIYESMLAKNQFEPGEVNQRILAISQAYMGVKNYTKALQYSERYLKEAGQDQEVLRTVAQIHLLQGDLAKTADISSKYIKSAAASGKPASEDWYKLWLKALFDQKKTTEYADAIEQTLAIYPSQNYWEGMITGVKAESSFNDRQNLILLRLIDALGIAKGKDYVEMAELSLASANPGDAKAALEKGMAAGLLTGDREKKLLAKATADAASDLASLASIEKQAAAAPNGESLVRIGEAYLGHGQFDKAAEMIAKGIAKGGVSFKDESNINLGIAYLGAKKQADAIKAFKAVPASSKVARLSRLWAVKATTATPAAATAKPAPAAKAK
jgi:hypothetical protein